MTSYITERQCEQYRDWLRPGGCACSGPSCVGGLSFHHVERRGAIGSDPILGGSDFAGFWLCWYHHRLEQDRLPAFEKELGMPVWRLIARNIFLFVVEKGLLETTDAGRSA